MKKQVLKKKRGKWILRKQVGSQISSAALLLAYNFPCPQSMAVGIFARGEGLTLLHVYGLY